GLLKTIFRLLGIPPLNLFDAAATDLSDMFAASPEVAPYKLLPVDTRIFDPAAVRRSTSGKPRARVDREFFVGSRAGCPTKTPGASRAATRAGCRASAGSARTLPKARAP